MLTTISITNKWQIHIPKSLRGNFGLDKPGKVAITAEGGKIIITPAKSTIMQYAGNLHERFDKKKINIDKIRDLIDYSDL
ncbi:MAG: AbrB family transcription regulator [Candidatus Levybacteria bacterium]|nr:AbrB family transcription regulator [Candidatus Levybacteria bacterium]